ncbi:alpha/beta fold hydrolase [Modicisalibacter luteus]|uniref:alpha/beta fold hydrolase n=1 Tax=Modicisalibacter luteus TaxID=453962 RepID=UPI0036337CB1
MTSTKSIAAAEPTTAVAANQVHYRYEQVDDVNIFYREAGNPSAPAVLLLHGFAASSFMFRDLIPELADRYHVIAPDLPAFGFTEAPARDEYAYTFSQLAMTIGQFAEQLRLDTYALVVHDYGAPVGWRLAVSHPTRVTAIISQNGNAYEEGLGKTGRPSRRTGANPRRRTARRCMISQRLHLSNGSTSKV